MDVILVDLIELIVIDEAWSLETIPVDQAFRGQVLTLDLSCFFNLFLNLCAEVDKELLHGDIKSSCSCNLLLFEGHSLSLAEILWVHESCSTIFGLGLKLHHARILRADAKDVLDGL